MKNNDKVEFDIIEKDKRRGDAAELIADPSLAIEYLNWEPQYSDLDNIINTAYAWKNQIVRYK